MSDLQRQSWNSTLASLRWRQGEHVSIIGPTGCGKTTAALALLPLRRYVMVIATKAKDPLISTLGKDKYTVSRDWPLPDYVKRGVYWPRVPRLQDTAGQSRLVHRALDDIYVSGGWCLYLDEVRYIAKTLKLASDLETLWLQGRTLGISLVVSTQRPAFVPLEMYSQATYLFLGRETDKRNLQRLGEVGGVDTDRIRYTLPRLAKHDLLVANTRTGSLVVTNTRE